MISKVDFIKDFGIYKNFIWGTVGDIPDFKEKNIIYGWNYSGKTTLSRIFSSLEKKQIPEAYPKGNFKVSTITGINYSKVNISAFRERILVFNSDYIQENLSWEKDDNINAIFFEVGTDAKISKDINSLENRIVEINGNETVRGEKEKYYSAIENYELFENSLFTIESRRIKNDVFSSLIDFTKRNLKLQRDLVIQNLDSFLLKKSEVSRLSKVVKIESPKEKVGLIQFDINIEDIIKEVNGILVSEPRKKNIIEILDRDNKVLSWVESGLEINKPGEKCHFCNNTVSVDRIEELNQYYQNEASILRKSSITAFDKIKEEKERITSLNFPNSIQDLNQGYQEEFKKIKKHIDKDIDQYIKMLNKIESQLKIKINNKIYEKLDLIEQYKTENLANNINTLNHVLEENNNFTEKFTELIHSERQKYINHLVAKFLKDNKFLQKKGKYEIALAKIDELNEEVSNCNIEIDRLKALKNSAEEGAQQLNYFIKSLLGKDDIEIKFNKTEKKYYLIRGNQAAKLLSEGEKMAISFSHYLVTLKSLEQKNELKSTIVFIDDPISSLDGNHIFQINAILKDFLYEKVDDPNNPRQKTWKQKCLQLFISTHNYDFFNLLKEMPTMRGFQYERKNNKKESRYFISREINNSGLLKLPKVYDDFKSEYHYLFKQIFEFNEQPTTDKVVIMPNVLRRFLEIYTLAKYPSKDEVDDRATEIWGNKISKRICKPFHFFSHFNNIDRLGKHSELLADVKNACKDLIEQLKKDETHYKALKATL